MDPQHSRHCCCCAHWVEPGAHLFECTTQQLDWNRVAWIGRDWLEELWERLPPTVTVGGWYRPHLCGAAFLATHAFVFTAEDNHRISFPY